MINKVENASASTVALVDSPSSNAQSAMGEIVNIGNASDIPMAKLPPEMLNCIGSFLSLKDNISFNQALENSCLATSLDYRRISRQFNQQSLEQKIDILLESNKQNYNFSKFYAQEAQNKEELTDLFSYLFNEMSEDFRSRKALSEEIVAHVEAVESAALAMKPVPNSGFWVKAVDPDVLDKDKIQALADSIAENNPVDAKELVDLIFPDFAKDSEIRKEAVRRVEIFCATRRSLGWIDDGETRAGKTVKNLLSFLKMDEEYRGMPIDMVLRSQMLEDSYLVPIMQKISKKMQTLATEELRALLIMAADRAQNDYFCEKVIAFGAKDNPFYLKGSPYFYALKSDLLFRVKINDPRDCGYTMREGWDSCIFTHHVAYNADDAFLREYARSFDSFFQEGNAFSVNLAFFRDFYRKMERIHNVSERRDEEYEARRALMAESTPAPVGLVKGSPQYILNRMAVDEAWSSLEFLRADPNVQNAEGDTALHLFIKQGNQHELRDLIDLDQDYNVNALKYNIKNNEGLTPLMLLVQLEDVSTLDLLWRRWEALNLDINQRDNQGNTALHHAIMLNRKVMIYKLLGHKETDTTIVNNEGKTPYDLAESVGLSSVFKNLELV